MNKVKYIIIAFIALLGMTSCSEDGVSNNEYANWQSRNESFFEQAYQQYKDSAAKDTTKWKVIKSLSKNNKTEGAHTDYILVKVLKSGTGTDSPYANDTVYTHYRGNLIPSDSYADGYEFTSTWYGDYNESTMTPNKSAVSAFAVMGFYTAIQKMHVGDRWLVTMPYQLAYGTTDNGSIPAYSTLRFDITLHSFSRVGHKLPTFQ